MNLRRLREAEGQRLALSEALIILVNPGLPADAVELPTAAELESVQGFRVPPSASGLNLAVLVPKGQEALSPWIAAQFYAVAAQSGLKADFNLVLSYSYDSDQTLGVPFQIGEVCEGSGARAVLILGPAAESRLSSRAAEFCHAVGHILKSRGIEMGWIPHLGTRLSQPYLHALLDFAARGKEP